MNIEERFRQLNQRGETALIPYVTGGFPDLDASMRLIEEIAEAGADFIEVGIPFGDPVADGPTIQHSSHVALTRGITIRALLDAMKGLKVDAPRIAMTYLNPLMSLAGDPCEELAKCGVSGLIIPDLPLEEAEEWSARAAGAGVDLVLLAAPTSDEDRLRRIGERSRGFVYYVTVRGTTGARTALPADLADSVRQVKAATDLPVAAGFGIATPDHVAGLAGVADGVVIGSRLVKAIDQGESVPDLVRSLKAATRPVRS